MIKKYTVIYSSEARNDIFTIQKYISANLKINATVTIVRILYGKRNIKSIITNKTDQSHQ